MRFDDVTMITKHAETLKLLSLGSSDKTDLDVLTRQDRASRHGIAGYGSELKQVIQSKSQGTLTHTAIRILCLSKVRSHWYHTLRRLNRMTYPLTRAKYVRRRTFHRNFRKIQAENCSAIPQIILQYLAVTNSRSILRYTLQERPQQIIPNDALSEKRMVLLKRHIIRIPVSHLKEMIKSTKVTDTIF
jgi:hypothetical protein